MENYFGSNLKLLRKKQEITQEELASQLSITRVKLNAYENAHSDPTIESLIIFSEHFKVSIDNLIKKDFNSLSVTQLDSVMHGSDTYTKGSNIRVLATTVDSDNNENVELVNIKAKAGYTAGYNDPEYVSKLPTFYLPFLSKNRKYRTFQIDGDSMYPIKDKSYIVGEYISDWNDIKNGQAYVILTDSDGVVFKIVHNNIKENKSLVLHSLNHLFTDYEVPVNEVKEIWKFVTYFTHELPDPEVSKENMRTALDDLDRRVNKLRAML